MINTEVWVSPDFDTTSVLAVHHVRECGTIAPPVRFGWFIPLTRESKKSPTYDQDIHWTIFKDPKEVYNFDIQDSSDLDLILRNSFSDNHNKQ